jgi:predicted PurR-regulated permease PerM
MITTYFQKFFAALFLFFALDNLVYLLFNRTLFSPGVSGIITTVCLIIMIGRKFIRRARHSYADQYIYRRRMF